MSIRGLLSGPAECAAVLDEDPDLLVERDAGRRRAIARLSTARVLRRGPGMWQADRDEAATGGVGLLVLSGLAVRRLARESDAPGGAELLSAGDLLRPEDDLPDPLDPLVRAWRVLSPVRLALLDRDWVARTAPFPDVATQLCERLLRRSIRIARMAAIAQHRGLEDRIVLTFWELADRFGRVSPAGVELELPLTHELLADLVCARRTSVSTACGRLRRSGRLTRVGDRWILRADPPAGSAAAPDDVAADPMVD